MTEAHKQVLEGSLYDELNKLASNSDFKYSGDKNDEGLPNGQGEADYGSGVVYTGEFKDGKRQGKGKIILHHTTEATWYDAYEGDWENDFPNGKGYLNISAGGSYEGEFKNGLYDGNGVFEDDNDNKYEITWKNNLMHGKGTLTTKYGTAVEIEYDSGLKVS